MRGATVIIPVICGAASHKRLLSFALRNYLWFLVYHFWLLSEAFASLFVFLLSPYPAPTGQIW